MLWVGCWCLWGWEQPGAPGRWGWVLPGAWLEKLPWFYHAFSRDARCFAQIPLSSYLNVNTYRSIDGTWKSWVFHEHSVSLFLSCILCRTSQQQQSNFFQMIRNTFFFLSWFSNGSTRKLAVVCTRSFRFPYITKVLYSSLFHKAEKNHRCQPSKLVAVIGFIKSTIVWSFEERKKVSSCIFKNTLHLVLLKGLKKWKMRPDIVCSSGP